MGTGVKAVKVVAIGEMEGRVSAAVVWRLALGLFGWR